MQNFHADAISRELHDQVGQAIAAGLSRVELAEQYYENGETALARTKMAEVRRTLRWALEYTKRLAIQLRYPAHTDSRDIPELGIREIAQIAQDAYLHNAFLISREAMTNAIRHSGGTRITMSMAATPEEISAVVEDNGRGIRCGQQHLVESLGLHSMHERASQLGGTLTITTQPSRGTKVAFRVPLMREGGDHLNQPGSIAIARPGAPVPFSTLSGRKQNHAPLAGRLSSLVRHSTKMAPCPSPHKWAVAPSWAAPMDGASVPMQRIPRSRRSVRALSPGAGHPGMCLVTTMSCK